MALATKNKTYERFKYLTGSTTFDGITLRCGKIRAGVSPSKVWIHLGIQLASIFVASEFFILALGLSLPSAYVLGVISVFIIRAVTPLAGIEGAKQMLLSAITKGVPLVPEEVSKMPFRNLKISPICRLLTLMIIGLLTINFIALLDKKYALFVLIIGILFAILFFPIVQLLFARKPSPRQLEDAIQVGHEFLEKVNQTSRY